MYHDDHEFDNGHDHHHAIDFHDHHHDDHWEPSDTEDDEIRDALWHADNVELTTVGIDIGSSTSHIMFARLHLQRLTQRLSSRFVVVKREVLWRSPIWLTPYRKGNRIDSARLREHIEHAYEKASIGAGDVDTGAVILTGEALKRANARDIAELFAEHAGKFVCASAGHNLESILAAHGSGAVARSRATDEVVLNVDIGGGTTKLALVQNGEVLATQAIAVGARLVAFDHDGRIVRLEGPARQIAEALGRKLEVGQKLDESARTELSEKMAALVVETVRGELSPLARSLMVTPPFHEGLPAPQGIVFSGGVAEYLAGQQTRDFGDLAIPLTRQLQEQIAAGRLPAPVLESGERIRATVIGASQFSVQLSGNTIAVSDPSLLPIHNLPVLFPRFDTDQPLSSEQVAQAIRLSMTRLDVEEGSAPVALALSWDGEPYYPSLRALADGVVAALPQSVRRGLPLVLAFDRDLGRLVGNILKLELQVPGQVISIDNMELRELDYVDIGELIQPTNVVPVVIKSLLFAESSNSRH